MNDLINRQMAIGEIKKCRFVVDAIEKIKALPSAQSEIIHCKDCKHYEFADNRAFGFPVRRCEWTGFEDIDENDFCSKAERQEE